MSVVTIGEMLMPYAIGEALERINENTILKQLNTGNIFDIALQHQEDDILEMHFTYNTDAKESSGSSYAGFLVYAFRFTNGVWEKAEYDPYETTDGEVEHGKIVNPFAKTA